MKVFPVTHGRMAQIISQRFRVIVLEIFDIFLTLSNGTCQDFVSFRVGNRLFSLRTKFSMSMVTNGYFDTL